MRSKLSLVALFLFLLPVMARAETQHEALVRELYAKSGLEKQVQQLPLAIQAVIEQPHPQGDDQSQAPRYIMALMKATVPEAFAPEKLKSAVLAEFGKKLTDRDLKTVLKWFDSPLGAKFARLEEEASTPEAYAEKDKYKAQVQNSPPGLERLKVVRQLDSAIKATESTVEVAIGTEMALSLAINATLPREQQRPPAEISREIKKHRPEIEAAMKLESLVSLLYTYRSVTDSELRQYIKFAATPAGAKLYKVGNAALEKAVFAGGLRWGKAIGEALNQGNTQAET